MVTRGEGQEEEKLEEGGLKAQTSSYKVNWVEGGGSARNISGHELVTDQQQQHHDDYS